MKVRPNLKTKKSALEDEVKEIKKLLLMSEKQKIKASLEK